MKKFAVLLGFAIVTFSASAASTPPASATPAAGAIRRAVEPVPGAYIVGLKDVSSANVPGVAEQLSSAYSGRIRRIFQYATTGFSIDLTEKQAQQLARHPLVEYVEEVGKWHLSSEQNPPNGLPSDNSLWFLSRIDQRTLPVDLHYTYCEKAADVYIYLIDTGVYHQHNEFITDGVTRVMPGANLTGRDTNISPPGEPCGVGTTEFGHGTAVASIAAGNTFGVAKNAKIVPLRVMDCNGNVLSDWIAWALDWIMSPLSNPYYGQKGVVSMSVFQFARSCIQPNPDPDPRAVAASSIENEINSVVGHPYSPTLGCYTFGPGGWQGLPVVVSANNQHSSVSYTTPARMAYRNRYDAQSNPDGLQSCGNVISVGGTDENDQLWVCNQSTENCAMYQTYCELVAGTAQGQQPPPPLPPPTGSNYGRTVDIFAPAHNMRLAGLLSPSAEVTTQSVRSGTSYAAPLVAGVVARMQEAFGPLRADDAWFYLSWDATHVGHAIDPVTNNDMVVYRYGATQCSVEYP